jgi:hypothetical protein
MIQSGFDERLAPLMHPTADLFLLGIVVGFSLVAGLFFLRFWKSTRDPLFIAFALFFVIQGFNYTALLAAEHPNEGNLLHTVVRLVAVVGLLGAILWKNFFER